MLMRAVPPIACIRLLNRVVTPINPSVASGLEDDPSFPRLERYENLSREALRLFKAEIAALKDTQWNIKRKAREISLPFLGRLMHARAQLMLADSNVTMEDLAQKFHEGPHTFCH